MKFTGIYAAYYQDVCKQWNTLVAKYGKSDKGEAASNCFSGRVKTFNKTIDDFNGTSFTNDKKMIVNGVTKHIGGLIMSETILQIQCIYTLKNICFESVEKYYTLTNYSDIASWEDYDELFSEIEKDYAFILKMLKLYATELGKLKRNNLPAINTISDLQKAYDRDKELNSGRIALIRRRGVPEFKRYSENAVRRCSDGFRKGRSEIFRQPYHL